MLGRWALWAGSHPGRVVVLVLLITLMMLVGTARVEMEMTFFSMMPQNTRQVRDLKKITDDYPFSSSIVVVVDGRELPEGEAETAVKRTIDAMNAEFSDPSYGDILDGIYSKVDESFLREHGFLLTKEKDLKRMRDMYADTDLIPFLTALNDDLEREYSGDGAAMDDDESQLIAWVGGVERILDDLADSLEGGTPGRDRIERSVDRYLVGESYYLSRNEDLGLLFLNPRFTVNHIGALVPGVNRLEAGVKSVAAAQGVKAGVTGMVVVARDEMVTSVQGLALSMLIAMALILSLMVAVFRIRSTPLIIGIPLALGILWTTGMTGFILHRLNIMTAMYMVALVGLGVDYAIHLMTSYVQERDGGRTFLPALEAAFLVSGRGIFTGALTTAAAFYALLLAESEMVRELAVVAGTGILCELAAMMLLIPAILGLREKRLERKGGSDPMLRRQRRVRSDFAAALGDRVTARPGLWLAFLLAAGLVLGTQASKVVLEDNLMNMEAEGLESVVLQDLMTDEFGFAPDVLFYLSDDNNELPAMVEALEDLDSVKSVNAVSQWLPTEEQRRRRLPYLEEIRIQLESLEEGGAPDSELLLEELYRLEANLVEMGDLAVLGGIDRLAFVLNRATGLDNDGSKVRDSVFDRLLKILETGRYDESGLFKFQALFSPALKEKVLSMAGTSMITRDDLPGMIRNSFFSKKDETTLMTIHPRMNPWEGRYRSIFTAQVATVTEGATGMILAADQLTKIAESDGRRAVAAALAVVFLILLGDFRNLKLTILTYLPLLMSFLSLYGIMGLLDIRLDFVNIISIPLLVGIGIDDAVHIGHRYCLEGQGGMKRTLAGTGTAVALTTITTMIGFASFIPSVMRAMRSTGIVLTLAMALAFIFSVCFYPAVLVLAVEKGGWTLTSRSETRKKSRNKEESE